RYVSVDRFVGLLDSHEPPCISLYQPTHRQHPANEQDPILFRNLLTKIDVSLRKKYPVREVRSLLDKFETVSHDLKFWNRPTHGLSIFCSPSKFEIFELQRPVRKLLVIADSFHTKPLTRILQSADRFQVL